MIEQLVTELGIEEYENTDIVRGPLCHERGITGYGSLKSGVCFIGISPARDEVLRSRRPLTGPSGKLLTSVLQALGQKRTEVYCTNLVCDWKDNPSREEADKCNARLREEIRAAKPKLIVLLGAIVTEYFCGRKFGRVRGAIQWSDEFNCYIMATYHPAAILRSIDDYGSSKDDKSTMMIHDFVRDINKIPNVVKWAPGAPQAQIEYTVVRTPNEAQKVLDTLPRDRVVALDVETLYEKDEEQVEALEDKLLCVGVGTTEHAWVFVPDALYNTSAEGNRTSALEWPNLRWCCHYGIFDTQIMRNCLGVDIVLEEDTLLQSYSLDERRGIHKLKTLAREYLGVGFYEEDHKDDLEKLYLYNARDVVYTARLCAYFTPLQVADDVRDFYERILVPSVNVFKDIQYRGVAIDKSLHIQLGAYWGNRVIQEQLALEDMAEQAGWPGRLNVSSTQQLGKFLFQTLSLPIIKYTAKNAPCVDKDVIAALKEQHPFVQSLSTYRHLTHMFDSFITGLWNQTRDDGRAHAIVKLHGSRTGRPSYTKPALQTIPTPYAFEDDEDIRKYKFNLLRRLFVASPIEFVRAYNKQYGLPIPSEDDEMILIESDYGKAELWIAYGESGDQAMHKALISADYHKVVASENIFNKPYDSITGTEKTIAKRVNFGILYDIEENSLSKLIKCSRYDARNYIQLVRARNKGYEQWARQTQAIMRQKGELQTKTGRKRRIIILGNAVRVLKQAVNYPIQSTTSDVVLTAMIQLHEKIKALGGHLLFTVHDSILCEVPKSRLDEATKIIHDVMTAQIFRGVPRLPVEIKAGQNWGECTILHDCAKERCLW